jgi:sulfite oxidase
MVDQPQELSLAGLRDGFERQTLITSLQCAGNRRSELERIAPFHEQVLWGGDAVGTAEWTGVRLGDVLALAGVMQGATHVWFEGLDPVELVAESTVFGASIDLDRALAPDIVLAFEMNGGPLPPLHGAPLRVVVPGYIGARSVKWLGAIVVSDRPSANHFQADSYRLGEDPLERSQLNSFISVPADGAVIRGGRLELLGYATPSGGSVIDRVEVAVDDTGWQPAELLDPPAKDVWVRWRSLLDLEPGDHQLRVRASDSSGARQPEDMTARWNPKGYMNDAWHATVVRVEAAATA